MTALSPSHDDDSTAGHLAAALGRRYRLVSELGRGGMGIVFRATDQTLRRDVAIKLLPPDLAADPVRRQRFVREAQMAAGLSHPNIVSIHDVGESDRLVWFVMQLVEGETLRDRVQRTGPQSVEFTARMLRDIGYALAYAHAHGIIHRDIKPDNILIDRATGRALVADFGIAKPAPEGQVTTLTGAGVALGTTAYMSPEQAAAEETLDGRSDLYSLGLVGHYLLTGLDVHAAPNAQAVLARILTRKVPSVRLGRPDVPAWLDAALLGLTASVPSERYDRAERLLDQIAAGTQPAEVHPAARGLVRLLGSYAAAGTLLTTLWILLNGPPLSEGALGFGSLIALWPLLDGVIRASNRGVGWEEVRDAITDTRRQLVEERLWQLEGPTLLGAKTPWERVALATVLLAALTITLLLGFTHNPWGEPWGYHPARDSDLHTALVTAGTVLVAYSSVMFVRFFRLPRKGATEDSDWHLPRWFDWLGAVLFKRRGVAQSERPVELSPTPSTTGTMRLVDRAIALHDEVEPRTPV